MGKQFEQISESHQRFIESQKLFFVGTAVSEGRVNISPKGMDSFRVLGPNRVAWLNVTGSGNETAAHVQQNPRMTLMFCAFEGAPMIMRLYGAAKVVHHLDAEWAALFSLFDPLPGARQIFEVQVDLVQTSCGMAVPFFDYLGEREQLKDWAIKREDAGLQRYWEEKNQHTIDGFPTRIVAKNLGANRS